MVIIQIIFIQNAMVYPQQLQYLKQPIIIYLEDIQIKAGIINLGH